MKLILIQCLKNCGDVQLQNTNLFVFFFGELCGWQRRRAECSPFPDDIRFFAPAPFAQLLDNVPTCLKTCQNTIALNTSIRRSA